MERLPWEQGQDKIRIVVIGDLILDEYLEGQVSRISPEAPVPVHAVKGTMHRAGGAANAALNIQKVGGEAILFGILGDDQAAKDLALVLGSGGVAMDSVATDSNRPTIRKTRITAGRQQLVRIDWERVLPIDPRIEKKMLENVASVESNAVLISDYGKGCLTSEFVQKIINSAKVPVIIDPKGSDYERYRGADLITPNRSEACQALGLDAGDQHDKEILAKELMSRFGVKRVLLTLGAEGMMLAGPEGLQYLPALSKEVYDVSGAGDTVAAVISLGMAAGCEWITAVQLANTAASVVVGKWGTQPVERLELLHAMSLQDGNLNGFSTTVKIKTASELTSILGPAKTRNRRVVFTNGCFDILHAGHVTYLEEARSRGDALVVGVNSDRSVRAIKGDERPVISCEQRMRLLAGLSCIDYVVAFDEETPQALIERLLPNVLVKGADWDVEKIVGAQAVISAGGVVDNIELVPGLSTSSIIDRVRSKQGVDLSDQR